MIVFNLNDEKTIAILSLIFINGKHNPMQELNIAAQIPPHL